ncbi:MAG: glucose 1-dehydrogenase [Spirochaetales bacterium]|nr:glucose 1-dehydrogenase [Spirochaetales bacterium]
MPVDIKDKVVLITGGSSGIGRAAALDFASLGAKIVVTAAHNVAGGEETVKLIREAGASGEFIKADVSSEEDVRNMVDEVVSMHGRLDCAFNNAGIGPDGVRIPYVPLTDLDTETWDSIMNTNLKGIFLCLKYELKQMQKQEKGSIVNTASIGGLKMAPNFGAYGPSKAGVIAITRSAAIENAKNGIRVNVVCPGPTKGTNLMSNTMSVNPEEEKILTEHVIPMGKMGTVEDVARAVVWLCSDFSGFITGQALSVDGGMHIA